VACLVLEQPPDISGYEVDPDLVAQLDRSVRCFLRCRSNGRRKDFYAEVTLTYDATIAEEPHGRPFAIESLRAICPPQSVRTCPFTRQAGAACDVGPGEDGGASCG